MATTTTNLSLKKPALDDDALIADINNNMDTLDSTIGAPSSASAVDGANAFAKINSLNSKINSEIPQILTDASSSLTPASGITIATVLKYKVGKLMTYELSFNTTSAISSGTKIFTGIEQNPGTRGTIVTFLATDTGATAHYTFTAGDSFIYTRTNIPSGVTVRCTFSYFLR